ncbi:MAG: leucine-rich repeat domain-containing protein [Oscillospiraceae bacterium]|nr:leucine-rich repeat domain-containing protein [Oscillospiraceae bacterium]
MSKESQNNCGLTDEYYPKLSEIYVPEKYEPEKADVPEIELTEKQAVEQGWSFQKKSKSVRITNYHGKERDLIVPHKIGGKHVNELSAKAFMNTQLDRVQIPNGVMKAGRDLFSRSTVREVIFGSGLDEIPQYAFLYCVNLEHIILPDTVWWIRKEAFFGCKSLEYIKFPDSLSCVACRAFEASGLKGFSTRKPVRLINGSAFIHTPLHNNYKLIATKNDEKFLDILLVGRGAKVKLPKVYVTFKRYSLFASCSLDLSECTGLDLQNAIPEQPFIYNITVSRGQEGYYFGKKSVVKYTDGSPYPGLLRPIKQNGDELLVEFAGVAFRHQFIPSGYVHFGVKSLKITTKLFLTLHEHAFNDPELEKLEIDYYISAHNEIFSQKCTKLREVRWKGKYNKEDLVQYIPPSELISEPVHRELLKAFQTDPADHDWQFFDSLVIDKIFSDKRLERQYYFTSANPRNMLRQKQLILIAIDVLRGTPGQFANRTEMYSEYLKRHLNYAHKVCEKIKPEYPEYAEFLDNFK